MRLLPPAWDELTASYRAKHGGGTFIDEPPKPRLWYDYLFARRDKEWRISAAIELVANRAADDPYSDHDGVQADVVIVKPIPVQKLLATVMDRRRAMQWLARLATL